MFKTTYKNYFFYFFNVQWLFSFLQAMWTNSNLLVCNVLRIQFAKIIQIGLFWTEYLKIKSDIFGPQCSTYVYKRLQ